MGSGKQAVKSIKRAQDAGDSARFTSLFLASSFFCSQAFFQPAPPPLTQTVGRFQPYIGV